ncbi:single-stranded DNA-binding protein [Deinococcus sp. KNUC1210]|uniref:single-stranded DNA-binding protein n=1 Tax=Deinococcus sp. KNUC1210 TaxID=2917691 RepID=UPI001EF0C958|nr:single-stranded DNA-binding protein [Deinococcus sp. KNUC1210]ULH15337.1 single-stranded DNA-binding protein [Deinococcus sp. KNUC1210]
MPEPVLGSNEGASSILTEFTLSPATVEHLKDALRASLVGWATVRVQDERALVLPAPDLDQLYAGLEGLLGAAWSLRYAVDQVSPAVVRATLRLGGAGGPEREGLGQGHTLQDARLLALADVCRAYGAAPDQEGQWVEYDPEEGPNTAELEPQQPPSVQGAASGRPLPELVRDPQLERARKHIDDLLEGLKSGGLGKQAAQVLARRGYGNTVEESREVYKELKALQARG